jgi:SAM-dependent methyltransferase
MKRSAEKELMDLPGKPRDLFVDDLRNLRRFNRYLNGRRSVMKGLAKVVETYKLTRLSILDVGTGSGDIPRAIVEWGRKKGVLVEVVALELDAIAAQEAQAQTREYSEIAVIRGDGANAPFSTGAFDVLIASQLLHHFSEQAILTQLKSWSHLARTAIIVSDLIRHPVAYHGIRVMSRMLSNNVMTRVDAPLSVQKAFTLREWRELFQLAGVGPFQMFRTFPFRHTTVIALTG